MNSKDDLIFIAGPTASGKTKYAIDLAKRNGAVLINADSRQVYKFMDIGTNKGRITHLNKQIQINGHNGRKFILSAYDIENSGVTGYMFDIVRPDEAFSLSDFQSMSKYLVEYFGKLKQKLIFVGGTGLYIDALIRNTRLPDVKPNDLLRNKLRKLSREQLYDELYGLDEAEARNLNASDRSNSRRLVRKIEIAIAGKVSEKNLENINYEMYYPIINRHELYERINLRVEEMFAEGLIDEVENLIKQGYGKTKPLQGMGYKEVGAFLDGELTLEKAKEKMKQSHRNYAARQITWFEGIGRGYDLTRFDYSL
jgi:tRNA dimethylallyltransferase